LLKSRAAAVILLLSLLAVLPCQATTVVVIVVPEGIVLAADGLVVRETRDGSAVGTRASTKVFLNKEKRIGLSSVGFAGIEGSTTYVFARWARDTLDLTKSDTTVEQFTAIIKEAANKNKLEFSALPTDLLRPLPTVICQPFVSYVIVGYEQNQPEVNFVGLDILVGPSGMTIEGPRVVAIHRTQNRMADWGVYYFGYTDGLNAMKNSQSYAHKYISARLPREMEKYMRQEALTLEEAVKMARVMVDIEKRVTPNEVGYQTTVVLIPPGGQGSTTTYSQEVPITPKSVVSRNKSK
jgi:hypothetical protein